MNDVTAGSRVPQEPDQEREEPQEAEEDDIPSEDHTPEGTQPRPARAFDGDHVERHGNT
ncbi:MAG TPA: hypothetical protein VKD22_14745 [Ramlibacter sp.]|nr:hypothetical protein [Ramlibacter sp.]